MRLFIAMPLTPPIEESLGKVVQELRHDNSTVKWVRPENIHLTLRFLGETAETLAPDIIDTIQHTASEFQPVPVTIAKLGGFPSLNRARVIWAGLEGETIILTRIADHIQQAVRALGFEPDNKPFRAHLTLGRVRRGRSLPREVISRIDRYELPMMKLVLDRIVLYESKLTPSGPIYERLHESSLTEERFQ